MLLPQHLVLLGATLLALFEEKISAESYATTGLFDPSLRIVFFHVVPDRVVYQLLIDLTLCTRARPSRWTEKGKGTYLYSRADTP